MLSGLGVDTTLGDFLGTRIVYLDCPKSGPGQVRGIFSGPGPGPPRPVQSLARPGPGPHWTGSTRVGPGPGPPFF